MSQLQTNEHNLLTTALTSFVLNFESTSCEKRRKQMQQKMARCYDQAIDNVSNSNKQAQRAAELSNSLQSEHWNVEAEKWQLVANAVLQVVDLINE